MTAPAIARARPRLDDSSTVVALIALREAVTQWRLDSGRDVIGSLDKRPLPITLREQTEEENRAFPALNLGPRLRVIFHHGPEDMFNVSGPLTAAPVIEELAAWDAYQRDKRWFSRGGLSASGLSPSERILVVQSAYRGAECDYHARVIPSTALMRDERALSFHIATTVRHMDRCLDRLVMARLAGPAVVAMLEGDR